MNTARPLHPRNSSLYMMIIGAGLVLVGISAYFVLPHPQKSALPPTEAAIPLGVNYPAPDLSLNDLQGNPVSLADARGQVVLVNLWATWCPPCKKEMPALQAYYEDHKQDGFTIVAINDGDPAGDVAEFVRQYGLTFPVWLDPTYIATEKAFQTLNLPSSFLIDRQGIIRLRWVGETTAGMLESYVTPMIRE